MTISSALTTLGMALAFAGAPHGELHERIAALSRLVAASPACATLRVERADLYRLHREWAPALADLERAAELDPSLAVIELARARVQRDQGALAEAAGAAARFLARTPGHAEGWLLLARIERDRSHHGAAAAAFDRALALAPGAAPEPWIERAQALEAGGTKPLDAILSGLEAGIAAIGPATGLELEALRIEIALGRTEAALVRIDRLACRAGLPAPWLARRGRILEDAGRPGEALAAYEAARQSLAALPPLSRRRGSAAALARDVERALRRLETEVGR